MPWLTPDAPERLCPQSWGARFCRGTPASLVHGGLWARDRSWWGPCQLPLGSRARGRASIPSPLHPGWVSGPWWVPALPS